MALGHYRFCRNFSVVMRSSVWLDSYGKFDFTTLSRVGSASGSFDCDAGTNGMETYTRHQAQGPERHTVGEIDYRDASNVRAEKTPNTVGVESLMAPTDTRRCAQLARPSHYTQMGFSGPQCDAELLERYCLFLDRDSSRSRNIQSNRAGLSPAQTRALLMVAYPGVTRVFAS